MALFSTRSDYALILLTELAKRRGYVSLRTIAERHQLPYRYITRLASTLKNAGYISSREGVSGGYRLSKKPRDIKTIAILELFEGSFGLLKCNQHGKECKRKEHCTTRPKWSKLSEEVYKTIKRYTLADFT